MNENQTTCIQITASQTTADMSFYGIVSNILKSGKQSFCLCTRDPLAPSIICVCVPWLQAFIIYNLCLCPLAPNIYNLFRNPYAL